MSREPLRLEDVPSEYLVHGTATILLLEGKRDDPVRQRRRAVIDAESGLVKGIGGRRKPFARSDWEVVGSVGPSP